MTDDARPPIPWRCDSQLCGNRQAGYWISIFGVVLCLGCRPPYADRPELVLATGPADCPPLVLAGRTTSLAGIGAVGAAVGTDAMAAGIPAASAKGGKKPVKGKPTLWGE